MITRNDETGYNARREFDLASIVRANCALLLNEAEQVSSDNDDEDHSTFIRRRGRRR